MHAYVIGQLTIHQPEGYQEYLSGFMPIFQRYDGELLATSKQAVEVLEGSWVGTGSVLMRFPSLDAAHTWHADPDYRALAEIRHRTAAANLVIVEGIDGHIPPAPHEPGVATYLVAQIRIDDLEAYQPYIDAFPAILARHDGALLASWRKPTEVLEGEWAFPGTVILEFPTATNARTWYADPDYGEIMALRHSISEANLALIVGSAWR